MDKNFKKILPIKMAARYLGVSEATLRRWHADGSLQPTFVTPGGQRRYALADLEKQTKGLFRIAQEWVEAKEASLPEHDFYCATSDRFKTRHERMAHEMDAHPSWNKISSLISSAAGEIGNNSFDHNLGNWPDTPGCFFAYDLGKKIIVLADRGVGVLATLHRVKPKLKTHEEALNVAFTEIVTSRKSEHRGNGLKYVREALRLADASLSFQSGDAVLEIERGESAFKLKKADTPIRGSLVLIKF